MSMMEQGVWPEQPKCGHRNTIVLVRDFGPPTYFGFEPSESQFFTMTIAWHGTYWTSTKQALKLNLLSEQGYSQTPFM